ncbi:MULTISPECIES: PH domain-containing protein [unclassified Rathayibacter]|uniref:PH domain-containing protein n=1 Tax=unclassified Rathayibacter TaxID=2609250 RepID=UPI001FB3755B|nr:MULTISPECIES: PH domain-containing protein [unclassified Rathayibacter]MCJ1682210.1 PH domain-containing protein [Rathayibacter sp. VKM Ac-2928]MCJ1685847.1 PH domain-containing protein [Rathayibacter sp. VKM Ac-2927]
MSAGGRDRLTEGDRELARLTPRARRAVAPVAGFLLLTWTGFYFAAQFELELQRWIIALGAAVLVLLLCVPGIAGWASIRYRITQRGLHARRGVLSVRRADLDFDPRMAVGVSRSLSQRIARCGDVRITRDGAEAFVLRDVEDPELVAELLRDAIAAVPMPLPDWPAPDPL